MHVLHPAWESITREFEAACAKAASAARAQILHDLNQASRRLEQYQTEAQWISAILDGASHFAHQVAIFELRDGSLRLRGQRHFAIGEDLAFPIASAGAFESCIQSKDPVVALRTPAEVSETLSTPNSRERAHLLPITNGSRVVAVLFATDRAGNGADASSADSDALELIARLASFVLDRQSNALLHAQITPAAEPTGGPRKLSLPSWANLDEKGRELHIRAQRFARVAVAEMQLLRPEACQAGRDQANVYVFLKKEIDRARESFRKQFMTIPSMVDYLHLELVHTAAEGDEMKLGADYPGQLV